MAADNFPDNLVIELRRDPSREYVAESVHVTNVPVQLHSPAPVVNHTYVWGSTPIETLQKLLERIDNREAT